MARVWSTVYGPNGFARNLTDDDIVWAIKATYHEVSNPATRAEWQAVLWTMLNRWASRQFTHMKQPLDDDSFGAYIRSFSSTVNSYWVSHCRSDEVPEHCPLRQAGVESNILRPISWYLENDPDLSHYVAGFFLGQIPPGPLVGVVDFAARWIDPGSDDIPWTDRIPGLPSSSNAFYKAPWSLSWSPSTVRIVPSAEMAIPATAVHKATVGIGLAILLGTGIVAWARRRQLRKRLAPLARRWRL